MSTSLQTCIHVQMSMHRMGIANNVPPEIVDVMKDFLFDNVKMRHIQEYTQMNKLQLHLDLENIEFARTMDEKEWSAGFSVRTKGEPMNIFGTEYKLIQGIHCGDCGEYVGSVTDLTTPIASNIWCDCTDHGDFSIVPNLNGSIRVWIEEEDYDF